MDPFMVHRLTRLSEQDCDPTEAITAIGLCEFDNIRRQRRFIIRCAGIFRWVEPGPNPFTPERLQTM